MNSTRPNTICHPEALADWRANDEDAHSYLTTVQEQINIGRTQDASTRKHSTHNNTLPKKQAKPDGLLALRLKEAIERENRKRGTIRKEGEA
jgi:hypothetical protein